MNTATTYTETVDGLTFQLTDHGDHVTTSAEASDGGQTYIVAQPQQARDGSTAWTAHLWFGDVLCARSPHYTATAATAAAAAFDEFVETFVDCFQCGKLRHQSLPCDPCAQAGVEHFGWGE